MISVNNMVSSIFAASIVLLLWLPRIQGLGARTGSLRKPLLLVDLDPGKDTPSTASSSGDRGPPLPVSLPAGETDQTPTIPSSSLGSPPLGAESESAPSAENPQSPVSEESDIDEEVIEADLSGQDTSLSATGVPTGGNAVIPPGTPGSNLTIPFVSPPVTVLPEPGMTLEPFIPGPASAENCQDPQCQEAYSRLSDHAATSDLKGAQDLLKEGTPTEVVGSSITPPLHIAAETGHLEIAKLLVSAGADVEFQGTKGVTPLMIAASTGHFLMAKFLISSGADTNAQGADGQTALMAAASKAHLRLSQLLLDNSADPSIRANNGEGPLDAAAEGDATEIILLLLEAGVPIDVKDSEGETALWIAAYYGSRRAVQQLLEKGADKSISDDKGITPEEAVCNCVTISPNKQPCALNRCTTEAYIDSMRDIFKEVPIGR